MPKFKPTATQRRQAKWLYARFKENGYSGRHVSEKLALDASSFWGRAHGKYRWAANELRIVADHAGVTVDDILNNYGFKSIGDLDTVLLSGVADETGLIKDAQSGDVPTPGEMFSPIHAVRLVAPRHPNNGWIFYYRPVNNLVEAVGRLSVVQVAGRGRKNAAYLRTLARGEDETVWTLNSLNGEPPIENVLIKSASPISWIKT